MKLVVGLGNPGSGYTDSPHNLGFMCVQHFARINSIKLNKRRCRSRIGHGRVAEIDVIVARPQTYMNRSGEAVGRLVKKYKTSLDDLIVIHDDMDLPLGKIRIRPGGSSAGHKGIESIISNLGSQDFCRVRAGIGRPTTPTTTDEGTNAEIVDYLLSKLPPKEKEAVNKIVPVVSDAILCLITEGVTAAMNKYN